MIIWLIGISGAGKTTIGRKLEAHFNELGVKNYLLDGDEVRDLFDRDLGYSDAEREANIKRIILGAYLLDRNDIAYLRQQRRQAYCVCGPAGAVQPR